MTAPEEVVERQAPEESSRPPEAPPPASRGVAWAVLGGVVLLVAWLAVRPSSPEGAAATVDLLVLPAVLFVEAWLLAGTTTIGARALAVLFGLGAVLATSTAVLLEWPASHLLSPTASGAVGSVVEVLAPSVPVVVVAVLFLRAHRRPTLADLGLAGLASGLGFLVVGTSLVTAASHRAPSYVSPLVAGWQEIPAGGRIDPVSFVGPGVGTALVGLAIGASIRWGKRSWRLAPPLLALCLVGLDRAVFDRQLRHAIAAEAAPASSMVDVLQRLTFSGRLELVLVVLGFVAGRLGAPATRPLRSLGRRRPDRALGVAEEPQEQLPSDAAERRPGPTGDVLNGELPGQPPGRHDAKPAALCVGVAGLCGALFVALARGGHLGFIRDRPVGLVVSSVGLGYSVLRLAALRAPGLASLPRPDLPAPLALPDWNDLQRGGAAAADGEGAAVPDGSDEVAGADVADDERDVETTVTPDDGRPLLCVAAVAASALGILTCAFSPPAAVRPFQGGLLLDAVRGWVAHVGHPGLLLGIAGLAAPPGPVRPGTPGGWRDLQPGRMRASGWWRGLAPRSYRVGWAELWGLGTAGADARLGWRGPRAGRLPWLGGHWRPVPLPEGAEEPEAAPRTTITVESVDEIARSQVEFEGPTVQEAMEAALRHADIRLHRSSLQLVDEGQPVKAGKAGSGRPARVRVMRAGDDAHPLRPPGRDSILRSGQLAVVVEVGEGTGGAGSPAPDAIEVVHGIASGPPARIEVTLARASHPSEAVILTCSREEVSPGRARYRSNPYSLDQGEDPSWVAAPMVPTRGLRVEEGDQLRIEHGGEVVAFTVHDTWASQVIAVNRALLDVTAAHHVTALAQHEQPGTGPETEQTLQKLRVGLERVEAGRRLLSSSSPDDEKAFLSTALLHQAMSLEPERADTSVEAAAGALDEHRRRIDADPTQETVDGPYRRFLDATVVGRLWTEGAASADEVESLVGWS
jgi:hypothetical protein